VDYCRWLSEKMSKKGQKGQVQLPSEAEWEFVASGTGGREYPWNDEVPDTERCNYDHKVGDTTSVGAYPKGATPEGVLDLAGNVWEWTRSKWVKYPYPSGEKERREREELSSSDIRVLRGGSFGRGQWFVRCASRHYHNPDARFSTFGFRVVLSPLPSLNDEASEF
jgi:formylglycine-generating enzyme required for sulfatase activity